MSRRLVVLSRPPTDPPPLPTALRATYLYDVQVDAGVDIYLVDHATPAEASSSKRVRHRMWPNLP
jgi:hypothetical protein